VNVQRVVAYERGLDRFQPLQTILTYDDFNTGMNGWLDLTPNFTEDSFNAYPSVIDKSRWAPPMLSTATFSYVGTHGAMEGTYSLKLSTKPVAGPHEAPPVPGSIGHALKRMSKHRDINHLQAEMWYAYAPEQDRPGLGEEAIRAFGFLFDVQDTEYRYMPCLRYVNAANGEMKQRWQYGNAAEVTDEEWAYGAKGEWHQRGIDPQWYGRRYPDGTTDGFKEVPDGHQELLYNETNDKINWIYFRLLVDLKRREYVEFQSKDRVFDLREFKPTLVAPYARIENLINATLWVENDTDRGSFLFVDSIVVSID
jgi:hypothetical protein